MGSRGESGAHQLELLSDGADTSRVGEQIAVVYESFRAAVQTFGGVAAFAAAAEAPLSRVSMKLRRAENQRGEIERSQLDYVGILACDLEARRVFLEGLCDAWGFERPEPKRVATAEELYEALLAEVEDSNGVGKAIKERAAKRIGVDSGAFRRGR